MNLEEFKRQVLSDYRDVCAASVTKPHPERQLALVALAKNLRKSDVVTFSLDNPEPHSFDMALGMAEVTPPQSIIVCAADADQFTDDSSLNRTFAPGGSAAVPIAALVWCKGNATALCQQVGGPTAAPILRASDYPALCRVLSEQISKTRAQLRATLTLIETKCPSPIECMARWMADKDICTTSLTEQIRQEAATANGEKARKTPARRPTDIPALGLKNTRYLPAERNSLFRALGIARCGQRVIADTTPGMVTRQVLRLCRKNDLPIIVRVANCTEEEAEELADKYNVRRPKTDTEAADIFRTERHCVVLEPQADSRNGQPKNERAADA